MSLISSLSNQTISRFIAVFLILSLIATSQIISQTKPNIKKMEIKLYSSAFKEGNFIPDKFSCEGTNISPQLHWRDASKNVRSFAIIVDDPDAPSGDFVHWVIYNIPGNLNELPEDVTPSRNIPDEVMLGTNGFGRISYGGPCPPPGKPHRYFFKIYALDTVLRHLEFGATKQQLLSAMNGHIIAEGHLMGKYQRSK